MGKKAILFDLDGTLTDSGEGIMNCAGTALQHFGIEVADRQDLAQFVGPPPRKTFRKFGVPADQIEEAIRIYRREYALTGKYENFPYPGIRELLVKLKNAGYLLYVATSKPQHFAVDILEHFGLADCFELIAGAIADGNRDVKHEVIAYVLEQIGPCDSTIMVGDTIFDVDGAAVHKLPTVGVSWGYGNADEMKNAGAIAIADNMDELFAILTKEKVC